MNNEQRCNHFNYICVCHQQWCQGRLRPKQEISFLIHFLFILGVILIFCGISEFIHARSGGLAAAAILIGCVAFMLTLPARAFPKTWSSFFDDILKNYKPADVDAFRVLQASVVTSGKLEKEALGQWIELERKALATVCSPSTVSESKDTCEGQS